MIILMAGNVVLNDGNLAIINTGVGEDACYIPIKMKRPRIGHLIGSFNFSPGRFTIFEEKESFDMKTDPFAFLLIPKDEYQVFNNLKIEVDNCVIPIKYYNKLEGDITGTIKDLWPVSKERTTYYPHIVKLR